MKFGHNLPRNQVPEWSSRYINYKGLKKLIKSAAEAQKAGQDADLAGTHMIHYAFNWLPGHIWDLVPSLYCT
jgi:hypothetical protein